MIIFYAEECDGDVAFLTDSEAIHCKQALRKREGEIITITDGNGKIYTASIENIDKKTVKLKIIMPLDLDKKRPYKIHIAIAPTKNISRFEWFLEKATEFGIDEITPILCQRSERKIIREDRLTKILISAMKQSLKSKIPKLNSLTNFSDFIKNKNEDQKFIAHLEEEPSLIFNLYEKNGNAIIMIGPEGDFTKEEIILANKNDFNSVSLGDYRLRTETAGIAAVQAIHFQNL